MVIVSAVFQETRFYKRLEVRQRQGFGRNREKKNWRWSRPCRQVQNSIILEKNLLEIFRTTLEIACIINFAVIISFRLPLSLACLWWMWWTKNLSYCTTSEAKTIILNNIFKGGKQSKIKKFSSAPFLQPALWREQLSSILDYFNFTTSQNVFAPQGEGERREFMNSFIEKSVLLFVMIN